MIFELLQKLYSNMKIIDEYYLITIGIILIGLPLLFYLKLSQPNVYTYNIVIYGDTIDASMLAYYIQKQTQKELQIYSKIINFNITLISPPQIEQSQTEEARGQLNKQVISFCGVEKEWMDLLDDTNLKYYIKEYGIYFGELPQTTEKQQFRIYSHETSLLNALSQYGLSNYAVKKFFKSFATRINKHGIQSKPEAPSLQKLSTLSITKSFFPSALEEDGLKFFSQTLGLDQAYIERFIFPVIYGNYLHQTNTLSALYKLLPIYCNKNSDIGQSLVLFEHMSKIRDRILKQIQHIKVNFVNNKILQTYSLVKDVENEKKKLVNVILTQKKKNSTEEENQLLVSNQTLRTYIKGDIFFIFQNLDSTSNGKQFSYYKTIIDGKIRNDHLYEQFFTIYLKPASKLKQQSLKEQTKKQKPQSKQSFKGNNPIYSITRICAYNCKGYENSVYILISKHKLTTGKNLNMFETHNIIYFKKYFLQQSQMPNSKKLQENENVYKIYDIDSLSDSYEFQLSLIKKISNSFIEKIKKQYLL